MDTPKEKHDHASLNFPEGFLWGAATSAFQVEGNVVNSDWWEWEQKHQPPEKRSGQAADQYNRFEEDFKLAQDLGHNAHRLSLEWSRIEPEEGFFNQDAIDHYIQVLKSLKDKEMSVMLTLHHFSNPAWFAKKGGWESGKAAFYFERFVKRVAPELKDYVDLWVTINEPTVYLNFLYHNRHWPGGKKVNFLREIRTFLNLVSAHKKAYKTLHQLDPHKPVGITNNVQSFAPDHMHSLKQLLAVYGADLISNHSFYFFTKGYHDFLGVNYYLHVRVEGIISLKNSSPKLDQKYSGHDVSDLGWEIYPEGIFDVLTDMGNHLPIYLTECGIATTNDDRRTRFLLAYLQETYRAIKVGVNIQGFFYWSLIDNMELNEGFDPRFGLIEVDFKTQQRTPRPSAYVYKDIIKNNGIHHKLLKLLGHTVRVEEVLKEIGGGA